MDNELMKLCDEFLMARSEERGMPHDFDDVTWVMHDFVLWMRERAAQETGADCIACSVGNPGVYVKDGRMVCPHRPE